MDYPSRKRTGSCFTVKITDKFDFCYNTSTPTTGTTGTTTAQVVTTATTGTTTAQVMTTGTTTAQVVTTGTTTAQVMTTGTTTAQVVCTTGNPTTGVPTTGNAPPVTTGECCPCVSSSSDTGFFTNTQSRPSIPPKSSSPTIVTTTTTETTTGTPECPDGNCCPECKKPCCGWLAVWIVLFFLLLFLILLCLCCCCFSRDEDQQQQQQQQEDQLTVQQHSKVRNIFYNLTFIKISSQTSYDDVTLYRGQNWNLSVDNVPKNYRKFRKMVKSTPGFERMQHEKHGQQHEQNVQLLGKLSFPFFGIKLKFLSDTKGKGDD